MLSGNLVFFDCGLVVRKINPTSFTNILIIFKQTMFCN